MCLRSHTGREGKSCLTADIWLRVVIQYLPDQKVNLNNCDAQWWYDGGIRVVSWWYHGGIRVVSWWYVDTALY